MLRYSGGGGLEDFTSGLGRPSPAVLSVAREFSPVVFGTVEDSRLCTNPSCCACGPILSGPHVVFSVKFRRQALSPDVQLLPCFSFAATASFVHFPYFKLSVLSKFGGVRLLSSDMSPSDTMSSCL